MYVYVEEVAADSVLAENLTSESGSLILSRGTRLTEVIINRLRRMGVETVSIESGDAAQLEAEREELLQELEHRFAGTEGNIYLQELKRVAIDHLTS